MWTREKIDIVLRDIQAKAPRNLIENVLVQKLKSPTLLMIIDKAIEDPDFPEEKKANLRDMKESGYFNKTTTVEDQKIAKQLDNYMNREINRAIKEGRLPTRALAKKLGLNKLHD